MKEEVKSGISIFNFNNWKREVIKKRYWILSSILFIIFTGFLNSYVGNYVDNISGSPSGDFLLDRIPVFELGWLFVIGIFIFIGLLLVYPLFFDIEKFAYTAIQFSFLVMIRNLFLPMTNLIVRAEAVSIKFPGIIEGWNFNNDLFFSGHVAIPFLGFLIFKDSKIKWVFLVGTIFMALVTLLTHRHYSIDIFAAPFIAYGCYKLVNLILEKLKASQN